MVARLVGASDGLASERTYTLKTLPQGVVRGLTDAVFRRDRMGMARAGAIIAGLMITSAGYVSSLLSQRVASEPQPQTDLKTAVH